jgi:hypothetical protein
MNNASNAKRKSFSDDVADEMGDGPGDDYSVDMGDEEKEDGEDGDAQEDRVMAVKELGKAMGVQIADPEKAAQALKTFIDSCS